MRLVLSLMLCLLGGGVAAQPGPIQWTVFTDPNEQAFTAEAPQGWHVQGGMFRHTATDPSIVLRILSPDRRTYLMIGDSGVTLFTTPTQFGAGSARAGVRPYLPGVAFAREYVNQAVPSLCSQLTLTGQRERPDLAQGPWTQSNPQARHDGGEATFTCLHAGAPARGIIAAATYIYPTPGNFGGSLWTVDLLAGCIAPPEGYDAAVALVQHVIASLRFNPAWMQRQQAATAQAVRNIDAMTQQSIQTSEQQLATARRRMHTMDQQFESFDRIITGASPYADSAGNVYQLDNTQPYHWIGPGGRTVGTAGPAPPPGSGWTQMHEVPPQ